MQLSGKLPLPLPVTRAVLTASVWMARLAKWLGSRLVEARGNGLGHWAMTIFPTSPHRLLVSPNGLLPRCMMNTWSAACEGESVPVMVAPTIYDLRELSRVLLTYGIVWLKWVTVM